MTMIIPIVDENDKFLYYKDSGERDLHKEITRGSALWIINEKKEILVAKRSKNKLHFPNVWGTSVAGSLEKGESYEDNAIKEAKEEIGVNLDKITLGPKKRDADDHEYFAQYFYAKISSDTKFILQESEVDEVCWISLEKLKGWYLKNPEEFLPTFNNSLKIVENHENQNKKIT
ncbi:MAG: NUDIX domain-containing protein [Patescibacteria group bacterium]